MLQSSYRHGPSKCHLLLQPVLAEHSRLSHFQFVGIFNFFRAAAKSRLNKDDECIKDCEKALEIDPNYAKAYCRMGLVRHPVGNNSHCTRV